MDIKTFIQSIDEKQTEWAETHDISVAVMSRAMNSIPVCGKNALKIHMASNGLVDMESLIDPIGIEPKQDAA